MYSLLNTNDLNKALVGSKAATLARLSQTFTVPDGFIVLPEDPLDAEILMAFKKLGAEKVAVRSSAANEDSNNTTWAGQLETVLNVKKEGLIDAITRCRESANSKRASTYASAHTLQAGAVAVIVQKMVASRVSGVAFTMHPVTRNQTTVVEAVQGLGENLVGGTVTPDTYIEDGETHMSGSVPIINQQELQDVIALAKRVRDFLGYEVDIEWAFDNNILYLLQARPITTV